jgi:UDP-N-acetyl-2-amino-2-deoxyglucuronate dehydrogenase
MSKRLRLGLAGCGGFGKELAAYFMELTDVVALCDVNETGMAATAQALGLDVPQYTDYRAMLAAGGLDAVIITAANHVHAEIAIAAAQAGLHVFCEKAMARTVPECWAMVRASQENHVKLMVGHKRRLRPPWARVIQLTGDAFLGAPLSITASIYADNRPTGFFGTWWADPKLCGGFFHAHGVHVIDWFRALCGDVATVTALYGPQHDSRYLYPDIIHATYRFKSGALASICGGQSFPLHVFKESEVPWGECRHGGFKLMPYRDHIDIHWQRLDEQEAHHERFDAPGIDHAFRLETGDFVRWIQEERAPCLTWIEGLRCVEMMEAAYRSAAAGGQPIHLPLYPALEQESQSLA